ncbi:hypothetical protein QYE76_067741 [Lolium multiflorum]|uniref:Uncharacterized protein n=1 Tax=Lolium multiflorum TaxID=4521 RepID=A0AAD8WB07_LOLMU|nr:hypothetical protein QYE76_067741 [Lolium multiflorum]
MAVPLLSDFHRRELREGEQSSPVGSYPRGICIHHSQTDSPTPAPRKGRLPSLRSSLRSDEVAHKAPMCPKGSHGPQTSSPSQEVSKINETSGSSKRCRCHLPPGPSNSPRATDHSSDQTSRGRLLPPRLPSFLGRGVRSFELADIRPDSIEPAAPKIGEEPNLGADGPLQRLKALLSSPVDTLVEDPETIRGLPVDIQPRLPKEKCQRLNEKKAALDAKTATSTHSARLETLRQELEDLERRARETKQLIQDEESLIARSEEEAQGLTADLKTDLAEIRALSSQR